MNNIAYLKDGVLGLKVREKPNGKQIDALDPTMWVQLTGNKRSTETVTWVEVFYTRKHGQVRGWVAEKFLVVSRDPMFVDNLTVHEHQTDYLKSITFPKKPDLGERMPETEPVVSRRGFWLLVGFGALAIVIFLTKIFLHLA